jgi:general secretion pathway protein A
MYYQHFGLNGPPFASGASPAALFLSAGHREGLAALQWGLREPSGFTMLVGEIGTGKTTLIHSLLEERHHGVRIVSVSNPRLSFDEMLRVIAAQLGVTSAGSGKLELIQALDGFLAAQPDQVALILDEAQEISDETLAELRLLSNSQTAGQRRLQMVLVGQLELARRLTRPELRQLNQRIGARALLPTLRPAEVRDYVEYRLRACQGDIRRLFKRAALRELAHSSGGIPRRINVLCHNALILAYAQRAARVGAAHMREAARDYDNLIARAAAPSAAAQFARRGRGLLFKTVTGAGFGAAALGAFYFLAPRALSTIYPEPVSAIAIPAANVAAADPAKPAANQRPAVQCSVRPAADQAAADAAAVGVRDSAGSHAAPPQSEAKMTSASSAPAVEAEAGQASSASAEKISPLAPAQRLPQLAPAIAAPATGNGSAKSPEAVVVVEPGDTLSSIALRSIGPAGTDGGRRRIAELLKANPQIEDANHIYPGQIINLAGAAR